MSASQQARNKELHERIASLEGKLHDSQVREAHLVAEVERLTARANRGCHSACLEHDELPVSHHPDCVRRKWLDEVAERDRLAAECERLRGNVRVLIKSYEREQACHYKEAEARLEAEDALAAARRESAEALAVLREALKTSGWSDERFDPVGPSMGPPTWVTKARAALRGE